MCKRYQGVTLIECTFWLPYLASSDFLERCIDENKIILKDVMITFHRIMNLVADFIWVKIGL